MERMETNENWFEDDFQYYRQYLCRRHSVNSRWYVCYDWHDEVDSTFTGHCVCRTIAIGEHSISSVQHLVRPLPWDIHWINSTGRSIDSSCGTCGYWLNDCCNVRPLDCRWPCPFPTSTGSPDHTNIGDHSKHVFIGLWGRFLEQRFEEFIRQISNARHPVFWIIMNSCLIMFTKSNNTRSFSVPGYWPKSRLESRKFKRSFNNQRRGKWVHKY